MTLSTFNIRLNVSATDGLINSCLIRCFLVSGFLAGSFLIGSAISHAESCVPNFGSDYEKIFCELKRSGRGHTLPSLYEFRNNPPLTQALLLKKPAERAGIKVIITERESKDIVYQQERLLFNEPVDSLPDEKLAAINAQPIKKILPDIKQESMLAANIAAVEHSKDWLSSCYLRDAELLCAGRRFQLITNQINQHLREGVLEPRHKLNLPAVNKATKEEDLGQAYTRYINGMIEIGLGASTMSYSKFVRLYEQIQTQKLNFVNRFETMYEFLKKDKASIGVSTKAMVAAGFNTRYCSELNQGLLACEHESNNYLFQPVN